MHDQIYIGAPNGVVVCVDGLCSKGCIGSFYHSYQKDPVSFGGLGEMIFRMEEFYDSVNFPRRSNNVRNFTEDRADPARGREKEKEKIMADQELLGHRGKQETFIIRVQHRQNNTWQGRITWADKNKTLNFRSIWEMVHLMENALYENASPEEMPHVESWEDEQK